MFKITATSLLFSTQHTKLSNDNLEHQIKFHSILNYSPYSLFPMGETVSNHYVSFACEIPTLFSHGIEDNENSGGNTNDVVMRK